MESLGCRLFLIRAGHEHTPACRVSVRRKSGAGYVGDASPANMGVNATGDFLDGRRTRFAFSRRAPNKKKLVFLSRTWWRLYIPTSCDSSTSCIAALSLLVWTNSRGATACPRR